VGLDRSAAMLAPTRSLRQKAQQWLTGKPLRVQADLAALPLARGSVDLAWSNLALHWVTDLPQALLAAQQCLRVDGLLSLSLPGHDSLRELRRAFAAAGLPNPCHQFIDMHDVGDMLVEAGFADPVLDVEYLTLTYSSPAALWQELTALGARHSQVRSLTAPSKAAWGKMLAELKQASPISMTVEVIYAHAWKVPAKQTAEGHAVLQFKPYTRGTLK
jgi:malonyl-CoA O-methyltransferase